MLTALLLSLSLLAAPPDAGAPRPEADKREGFQATRWGMTVEEALDALKFDASTKEAILGQDWNSGSGVAAPTAPVHIGEHVFPIKLFFFESRLVGISLWDGTQSGFEQFEGTYDDLLSGASEKWGKPKTRHEGAKCQKGKVAACAAFGKLAITHTWETPQTTITLDLAGMEAGHVGLALDYHSKEGWPKYEAMLKAKTPQPRKIKDDL